MLREYLGNLLGVRIRENFPAIQSSIEARLAEARMEMDSLGKPRDTKENRVKYLQDIAQRFEDEAGKAMNKPGRLPEALRVRSLLRNQSEEFAQRMRQQGHTHPFEDHDVDPVETLNQMMAEAADSDEDQFGLGSGGNGGFSNLPITPPSSRSSPGFGTKKSNNFRTPTVAQHQQPPQMADALFDEIRAQFRAFHTDQLPGLINPDVVPVLFQIQTENWNLFAREYGLKVADVLGNVASGILGRACPLQAGSTIVREGLLNVLRIFWNDAGRETTKELEIYCARLHKLPPATENPLFDTKLKALQAIRLMKSMQSLQKGSSSNFAAVFKKLHFSIEDNMVKSIHDILKVYYSVS
jgi:hypothetical protein